MTAARDRDIGRIATMDERDARDDFATAARAGRSTLIGEFWYYLKLYRAWTIVPVLLALAILGGFVMLGSSGVAPFIYALF